MFCDKNVLFQFKQIRAMIQQLVHTYTYLHILHYYTYTFGVSAVGSQILIFLVFLCPGAMHTLVSK